MKKAIFTAILLISAIPFTTGLANAHRAHHHGKHQSNMQSDQGAQSNHRQGLHNNHVRPRAKAKNIRFRIGNIETRLENLQGSNRYHLINKLNTRLDRLQGRLKRIQPRAKAKNIRFRIGNIETRLEKLQGSGKYQLIHKLNARLDKLQERLDKIQPKASVMKLSFRIQKLSDRMENMTEGSPRWTTLSMRIQKLEAKRNEIRGNRGCNSNDAREFNMLTDGDNSSNKKCDNKNPQSS